MQPCKLFFSCLFCGVCIGERAFSDLRSVPKAGRPREQVENHGMACTQVHFICKGEIGFFSFFRNNERLAGTFHWSEDPSTAWLVPSTAEDPPSLKTGFFRQVRELKIQRKNLVVLHDEIKALHP
jgi:hypothetical protein